MLCGEDSGSEHIQKSMHLCLHFIAELPDWMMQARREFDGELMRGRRDQGACDLCRSWKRIRRHSTGAQFVTKRSRLLIRIVFRE